MKVTIVGAGNMGRGIGTRAVVGGHDVEIVDRDVEQARALAEEVEEHSKSAVSALVTASESADLVVVGSGGLHGLNALGSVSERVAHQAQSSVLVVRETPRAP